MKAPLFGFLDRLQGVTGLEGLAVARIRLAYIHLLFKQAPELKPDQVHDFEHTYIHTYIYTHIHLYIHTDTHTHIHT